MLGRGAVGEKMSTGGMVDWTLFDKSNRTKVEQSLLNITLIKLNLFLGFV